MPAAHQNHRASLLEASTPELTLDRQTLAGGVGWKWPEMSPTARNSLAPPWMRTRGQGGPPRVLCGPSASPRNWEKCRFSDPAPEAVDQTPWRRGPAVGADARPGDSDSGQSARPTGLDYTWKGSRGGREKVMDGLRDRAPGWAGAIRPSPGSTPGPRLPIKAVSIPRQLLGSRYTAEQALSRRCFALQRGLLHHTKC